MSGEGKKHNETLAHVPHPRQPIGISSDGVVRFKPNPVVEWMLDQGRLGNRFDLNTIAAQGFQHNDLSQMAQLIGYSVSGYCSLSYVADDDAEECAEISRAVWPRREPAQPPPASMAEPLQPITPDTPVGTRVLVVARHSTVYTTTTSGPPRWDDTTMYVPCHGFGAMLLAERVFLLPDLAEQERAAIRTEVQRMQNDPRATRGFTASGAETLPALLAFIDARSKP